MSRPIVSAALSIRAGHNPTVMPETTILGQPSAKYAQGPINSGFEIGFSNDFLRVDVPGDDQSDLGATPGPRCGFMVGLLRREAAIDQGTPFPDRHRPN
jgi:hypothetical protein